MIDRIVRAARATISSLTIVATLASAVPGMAAENGDRNDRSDRARRAKPAPARAVTPVRPGAAVPFRRVRLRDRPGASTEVVSVTNGRAYLDAGSLDGIAVGQRLTFLRRGRPAGACTVEAVADRSATCSGASLLAGDTAALAAERAPGPPEPAPLPSPVAPAENLRRREALEAAPVALVNYLPPPNEQVAGDLQRVDVSISHTSFIASNAAALHEERIDARISGAEVSPGWHLFLDGSAYYRGNSAAQERFRTGDTAYLEVRELQVSSREPDRSYTAALGRLLPWSAPGATVVDGAQVGWRGKGAELGAFGGTVPDILTTSPTTSRATGGAYGALEHASDELLVRGEARIAAVKSPELGTRMEAEALGHAWLWRTVDLSAQARLGFGGDRVAPTSLDFARIDLSTRLGGPLWLTGSYRYFGLTLPDVAAPALFPNPAREADLTASLDVTRSLTLRFTGGYSRDLVTGLDRGYAGPEIALPTLFGPSGGMAAGWLEEHGWASGRNMWVEAYGNGLWGILMRARASLFIDDVPAPMANDTTVGLFLSASKSLASWLRFNLSALSRYDTMSTSATGLLGGLWFMAGLEALY